MRNTRNFFKGLFLSFTVIFVSHQSVRAEDLDLRLTQQDIDDRCAKIDGVEERGAYIFKEPDVYSEQLGTVEHARYVELEGNPVNDYYPVSIPLQGYIHGDFLTSCVTAKPPENCLQVAAADGIMVYKKPTKESETVGQVDNGRNIRVEESPTGEWVPVLAPISGYAPTDKLASCPPARFE